MNTDDSFSEQLETMRQRMLDLSRRSEASSARDDLVPEALEHLGTALEELSVTGEELREQTEELTRTRQAAEAERQRYQDFFENAPDGYLVTDAEGVIQEGNLAAAGMLGMRQDRLAGKPLLLFIGPADRTAFLDRLNRVTREGQPLIGWESLLQPRNGPAFPALLSVQPLGTISGTCSLRWILREAALPQPAGGAQEHDQTLGALARMAGRMAHHLASDLATIHGQAELLGSPDLPPKFRENLDTLKSAAINANELVRRVQIFSRLRPTARLEPTDLAAVVQEAVTLIHPQAQYRGIHVRCQLGDVSFVLGHAAEIREALVHLILNAVEATPSGGTLTISARSAKPEQTSVAARWLALTVTDAGPGMSVEVRQHLFEPFFTTKGVERAGLGLAMVHGIMRRQLGSVDIGSAPGQGCAVTLWFQIANPGAALAPPRQAGRLEGLRILLIDDNDMVRRTIAELLRRRGLVVVEAAGGAEGLARLAEAPVDLVLTDLQMPGMNGCELAQALKARTPDLPVVIITGWGESAAGAEEGNCPADRVVAKPIERDQLLAIIAGLVASRQEPPAA